MMEVVIEPVTVGKQEMRAEDEIELVVGNGNSGRAPSWYLAPAKRDSFDPLPEITTPTLTADEAAGFSA